MQTLRFSNANFLKVKQGKSTTIRLGMKCMELEPVTLVNDDTQEEITAGIIEVRHVRFHRLGLLDAVADGFNSEGELRAELEHIYDREIEESDPVTVIRFKVIY